MNSPANSRHRSLARSLAFAILPLTFCQTATAAELFYSVSSPSAAAINNYPELQDATVFNLFVTTETDILQMGVSRIHTGSDGTFFQHPQGSASDTGAPIPGIISFLPALEFDTFFDTPGSTTVQLCDSITPRIGPTGFGPADFAAVGCGIPEILWYDTGNDGPQDLFRFAQFTLVGDDSIDFQFRLWESSFPVPILVDYSISGSGANLTGATLIPEPSNFVLLPLACLFLIMQAHRRQAK